MPYCTGCGAEVEQTASFCHECGTEVGSSVNESSKHTQATTGSEQSSYIPAVFPTHFSDELVKQYSPIAWIGAIFSGLSIIARGISNPSAVFPLTIIAGLAVPGYFGYKTIRDEPINQTTLEVWTTIFAGIFGIAAVEFAGKKGAKLLWQIIITVVILFLLL